MSDLLILIPQIPSSWLSEGSCARFQSVEGDQLVAASKQFINGILKESNNELKERE
jgi:hypothetical protein